MDFNVTFSKKDVSDYGRSIAENYDYISRDLKKWINGQKLKSGYIPALDTEVDCLWSSYMDTGSPDSKFLTRYKRMFIYDVALAFYAQVLQDSYSNNFSNSKQIAAKIMELLKKEEEKGTIGLLHFSYNTSIDSFIDPHIITCSNIWVFKALYAYMLHSGDLLCLDKITEYISNYIFPLQIMDREEEYSGFIKAGYKHPDATDYGYDIYNLSTQPQNQLSVPLIVIKHNGDFIDLLRLMIAVFDRYSVLTYLRNDLLTRHELAISALLRIIKRTDHNISWPAAIKLQGTTPIINWSRSVDHYTALASVFLGIDEEIPWESITVLQKEFITSVASIDIQRIDGKEETIPLAYGAKATGLIFFPSTYKEIFVPIEERERDRLTHCFHAEATAAGIIFLYRFAMETENPVYRRNALKFMTQLLEGLIIIHKNYKTIYRDKVVGMPYATKNITNYFSSLPSMAASAMFYLALEMLKTGYPYFTGVPLPAELMVKETARVKRSN